MELYSEAHRALQDEFDTRQMADLLDQKWSHRVLTPDEAAFIAARDMFFLATVDPNGWPTVSYKGGQPGLVKVLNEATLAFPGFDGNCMWLSMGNIVGQAKVGMLFVDFESPHRFRVEGLATFVRDAAELGDWPEAKYAVRVAIERCWVNCPRYVHRYTKVAQNPYVPVAGAETPLAKWKRLDLVQDALPACERLAAEKAGVIDLPTYEKEVSSGNI